MKNCNQIGNFILLNSIPKLIPKSISKSNFSIHFYLFNAKNLINVISFLKYSSLTRLNYLLDITANDYLINIKPFFEIIFKPSMPITSSIKGSPLSSYVFLMLLPSGLFVSIGKPGRAAFCGERWTDFSR